VPIALSEELFTVLGTDAAYRRRFRTSAREIGNLVIPKFVSYHGDADSFDRQFVNNLS
jgi:hypothetical protein